MAASLSPRGARALALSWPGAHGPRSPLSTHTLGKRKGLIGLQLNSEFKRKHSKPKGVAAQIVEQAEPRALRVPGAQGEGADRRAARGQMDPGLPWPARGGRPHRHQPIWFKFILGHRELEQEMLRLSCPPVGFRQFCTSRRALISRFSSVAFEVHHLLLKRSGSDEF